jgi:hypothetical protein
MTIAHGPKLLPSQDRGNWYSSRNTSAHLQQVGTKPWVQEGTQLDLPDRTENKIDTKDHDRLYGRVADSFTKGIFSI